MINKMLFELPEEYGGSGISILAGAVVIEGVADNRKGAKYARI
jgi:hypothetical protein